MHGIKSRRGTARSAAAWLGRPDLNRRLAESKSAALPLGYTPIRNHKIEGPDRSPTKWIRFGKEEGVSVVQFSPRGGNGTVLTSSDEVVMPAGLEPGITSLRGLRPVRLDEGTIYGDPRRI